MEENDKHYPGLELVDLLDEPEQLCDSTEQESYTEEMGTLLIDILDGFGISAELLETITGPSNIRFVVRLGPRERISSVRSILYDIQTHMEADSLFLEAPIPGRNAIGFDIPNPYASPVKLRSLYEKTDTEQMEPLTVLLGSRMDGSPICYDLHKLKHIIIGGSLDAERLELLNTFILSLLINNNPDDVKVLIADADTPDMNVYKRIPHLIGPVLQKCEDALGALQAINKLIDRRLEILQQTHTPSIEAYNAKNDDHIPYLVVVLSHYDVLTEYQESEMDSALAKIIQNAMKTGVFAVLSMSKAAGDVISTALRNNFATRIMFAVPSKSDSQSVIHHGDAVYLNGAGQMIITTDYSVGEEAGIVAQISDDELNRVIDCISAYKTPYYDDVFIRLDDYPWSPDFYSGIRDAEDDPLYDQVKDYVIEAQKASTSILQRRFGVGYNRAERILDMLEKQGVIGPAQGSRPRDVYIKREYDDDGMDYTDRRIDSKESVTSEEQEKEKEANSFFENPLNFAINYSFDSDDRNYTSSVSNEYSFTRMTASLLAPVNEMSKIDETKMVVGKNARILVEDNKLIVFDYRRGFRRDILLGKVRKLVAENFFNAKSGGRLVIYYRPDESKLEQSTVIRDGKKMVRLEKVVAIYTEDEMIAFHEFARDLAEELNIAYTLK